MSGRGRANENMDGNRMGHKLDSATSGWLDDKSASTSGDDVFSLASKTLEQMLTDLAEPLPGQRAIEQQSSIVRGITRFMSGQTQIRPEAGDRRFSDPQWTDNPFYNAYMQCYLAWAKGMNDMAGFIGLDDVSVKRARYFINNLTDALSPTNTMVGNPGAMRRFVETGGKSALDGLKNFLTDLTENRGMPSQVDKSKYKVGGNLAITPGIVVSRTDVIEVIQYKPRTPEVYAIPVLIASSMINKFYALDLAPGRSFVEYALDHGMQVFIISWRNPTAAHKDWSFDTYVDAILQACGVVREICGVDQLHLLAVCVGGLLTSALLGYLAAKDNRQIRSSTIFVTSLDNAVEDTKLSIFATEETVRMAKQATHVQGVLAGDDLANIFAWMRPNDLVWSYWINNYLMGNPPPAFDILYWNNDSTRLPAVLHGEMLDQGLNNAFAHPSAVKVFGVPIDLSKTTCDIYVLAGATDHICPWKNVYAGAHLFGGQVKFILVGSGHVQSFINPPGNPKAKFFVNSRLPTSPDEWLETAEQRRGSAWGDWIDWVQARSGKLKSADPVGSERHPPLCDAPGLYVFEP